MALEVEYMMGYQHPVKTADSTVVDRKKAVVSYKPTPAEM